MSVVVAVMHRIFPFLPIAAFFTLGLGLLTMILTRGVKPEDRKRVLAFACLLPFGCVMWFGVVASVKAAVNHTVLSRDSQAREERLLPLANGFSLAMPDDDAGVQLRHAATAGGPGANPPLTIVTGIRELQLDGPLVIGAYDSNVAAGTASDRHFVDRYFVLDTQTGIKTEFESLAELEDHLGRNGHVVKLRVAKTVMLLQRATGFDWLMAAVMLIPMFTAFLALCWRIIRVRRGRLLQAQPA